MTASIGALLAPRPGNWPELTSGSRTAGRRVNYLIRKALSACGDTRSRLSPCHFSNDAPAIRIVEKSDRTTLLRWPRSTTVRRTRGLRYWVCAAEADHAGSYRQDGHIESTAAQNLSVHAIRKFQDENHDGGTGAPGVHLRFASPVIASHQVEIGDVDATHKAVG